MVARIYRPAKTAMQSGRARAQQWVLDFEPEQPRRIEPLMGWVGSADMKQQVRLSFATRDEAIAYATRHGIAYRVAEPHERTQRAVAYSDNFRYGRLGQWTH